MNFNQCNKLLELQDNSTS